MILPTASFSGLFDFIILASFEECGLSSFESHPISTASSAMDEWHENFHDFAGIPSNFSQF